MIDGEPQMNTDGHRCWDEADRDAVPEGSRTCRRTVSWRRILKTAVVAVFAATLPLCSSSESPAARRPNIVLIMADDLGYECLGADGGTSYKTPVLDGLAAEGARFANMFVTTSLCSPSRASMLSGLYAHAHKVTNNFTDYPADLASYPLQLQKAGYETAYIGKWHMGEQSDEKRPGFDYWITH